MQAKGTKLGAKAALADQKVWGAAEGEQETFDATRSILLALIDEAADCGMGMLTCVDVSAAGHGTKVSALRFSTEYLRVEPSELTPATLPAPAPAADPAVPMPAPGS
jgi:hypothetical protein